MAIALTPNLYNIPYGNVIISFFSFGVKEVFPLG